MEELRTKYEEDNKKKSEKLQKAIEEKPKDEKIGTNKINFELYDNNGTIELTLTNKGGEMSSLLFKGKEILYKGDGPYWTGKNPTLFPMISSPNSKQYTFEGKTYPTSIPAAARKFLRLSPVAPYPG